MFEWEKGNAFSLVFTLYANNFTLNNAACTKFKDSKWCMIGIDRTNKQVAIKPIFKKDIDLNIYPLENLHKVFLGKGYARISNKNIINEISNIINKECNGIKFEATFDNDQQMLIIDLNKPI